jgi:hypothetical protein
VDGVGGRLPLTALAGNMSAAPPLLSALRSHRSSSSSGSTMKMLDRSREGIEGAEGVGACEEGVEVVINISTIITITIALFIQ